jgi:SNF2 family DNA or RNA helicase
MKFYVEPWAHQKEAMARAKERDHFALFFEMGTGKTATTINILRDKFNQNKGMLRTLIVCPLIVIENWKREFLLHSKIESKDIVLLAGSGKKRLQTLEDRCWYDDNALPKIVVTNFESLYSEDLYDKIASWRPEALVVDESHKCKDPSSKRTKLVTKLADNADFKFILTGTPVLNSPLDLYSQFRILDGGDTFGSNFFAFRARYFYDKNAGIPKQNYFPNFVIRSGALEEINKKTLEKGMHVKKADCLDLPPIVRQTIHVEMTKDQARMYEEMKKEFITFLQDKAVVAQLAITKALRLQQIVSGFARVENDDGTRGNIEIKGNPRAEALRELLAEITPHSKVLVWAVFKENYGTIRKVCEDLKINFVEVHGDVANQQKHENVNLFNADPSYRVFIGHPGSGGIGINLVAASFAIFYSRSFSLEQDLQAEARNHRGGSEIHEKITRIDLVCPQTIDEAVLKRLASKQEIGEKVLKEIAKEI